ncbi:MAG: DNA-binding protein [Hyphomicrobiales bacterium]|nr:DNA-binding protein [Hyphomicrobiales bacterium]MCP5373570.1 DNA-binding protein [Hyphomicrobiales bacterium]
MIDEVEAARFLGFKARTMQAYRYRGTGPRYVKLSARAVKYRRADLRAYAEQHLHNTTADKKSVD